MANYHPTRMRALLDTGKVHKVLCEEGYRKGKREIRHLRPLSRIKDMDPLGTYGVSEKRSLMGVGSGI